MDKEKEYTGLEILTMLYNEELPEDTRLQMTIGVNNVRLAYPNGNLRVTNNIDDYVTFKVVKLRGGFSNLSLMEEQECSQAVVDTFSCRKSRFIILQDSR